MYPRSAVTVSVIPRRASWRKVSRWALLRAGGAARRRLGNKDMIYPQGIRRSLASVTWREIARPRRDRATSVTVTKLCFTALRVIEVTSIAPLARSYAREGNGQAKASTMRELLMPTPAVLRDRAAAFDRMARQAADPALRGQFAALKERFERAAAEDVPPALASA